MNTPLIELTITGIRDETPDTRSFILTPLKNPLTYKPGQFLTFVFPHKVNENRRSYSISSTPSWGEPLTITVKRLDNGEFSRYLFEKCSVGTSLFSIGPSGFFVLPSNPGNYSTFAFYAAGSGITPILPLIKTLLKEHPAFRVHLTYSNHSEEQTIFFGELQMLERAYPSQLRIEWLFSTAKNLLRARLSKYLVEEQVNNKATLEKERTLFYLCGPHSYMQMISITLLREGVISAQIRKEIFDNIKPLVREPPPDTDRHSVALRYRGELIVLDVQYPETILATAKRHGVVLPYSCEAGKCGTCAATCATGEVWMSYNEVLLEKELAQGRVLTCTGFPVKGDVELFYPSLE
jgi:ferredoxin-NADP reductase